MAKSTKSSSSDTRWAVRTLWSIFWVVVGVLGITTLNGYASSGFTHIPNAFMQIFGSVISPMPRAPKGYVQVTPALLTADFQTGKDAFLGRNVAVYGKILPWDKLTDNRINGQSIPINGLTSRPGTFLLALFADPEDHPEMLSRPITVTVRVPSNWRADHPGIQGQWVQVTGAVVAYSPGGVSQATPEIQSKDINVIQEPYDIYDHNIPIQKPGSDD
ncbi:MAG TPA: hypothetical protein VFJ58_09275 [Armatimonadota bacterium]|nr:hypothetical protein [Armatimonadota bacterium]